MATGLNSSSVSRQLETKKKNGKNQMMNNERSTRQLLFWLIITKGGKARAQIIKVLRKTPMNAKQLSSLLRLNYDFIMRQLAILEKNNLLVSEGDLNSATYFLSKLMEKNYRAFEEIAHARDSF